MIDLLAATKLVPEDKLALARGRAQQTRSVAAALVEEGVASFAKAFDDLISSIEQKSASLATAGASKDG